MGGKDAGDGEQGGLNEGRVRWGGEAVDADLEGGESEEGREKVKGVGYLIRIGRCAGSRASQ